MHLISERVLPDVQPTSTQIQHMYFNETQGGWHRTHTGGAGGRGAASALGTVPVTNHALQRPNGAGRAHTDIERCTPWRLWAS